MSRLSLVLFLALAVAACQSQGGAAPDKGEPAPPPRAAEKPPTPSGSPHDIMQVYFDLDQYTKQWMKARSDGDSVTWNSLERSVLRPMVDKHLANLLGTLANKDAGRLRIVAARSLGFGSDASRIVPALVSVLGEKSPDMVTSALASLYVLASPDTPLGPLVTLLNHPDTDARGNDALALYAVLKARRKDDKAVPLTDEVKSASGRLLALVSNRDEDPFVRANAAAALGEIGDPMATDVLVNLLGDKSSVVRTRAAEGLGELGQEQAIPPLIDLLGKSPSPNEAKVIVAALEKIALELHFTVNLDALGTDPANWKAWYMAVKSPAPKEEAPSR
jgi:hypothetical protein